MRCVDDEDVQRRAAKMKQEKKEDDVGESVCAGGGRQRQRLAEGKKQGVAYGRVVRAWLTGALVH
eukprot:m.95317 g.95317  ORF g.95317 m.95317 type:complete len:65 (-) comp15443_c1_seq1:840-1034(-)